VPNRRLPQFERPNNYQTTIDAHPQTTFLTQTNSLGVVTGMPAVITSQPVQPSQALTQPDAATSVGSAAIIPDMGPGLHTYSYGIGTNSTRAIVFSVNSAGVTSLAPVPTTMSDSPAGSTGTDGVVTPTQTGTDGKLISTAAATGSETASTGAAATMRAVAGSVVGVGAFMAAFL
jgi:hypothetical protein